MNKEELLLQKRLVELSNTAYQRDIVTFTDFLNLNELNILHSTPKHMFPAAYETYGGYEAAERQMVAFLPDALYYEYRYPVEILKISPVNLKFAENLSHRDYLGGILHLGIERCCLGDLLVSEECCRVFVTDSMADYICRNLTRIRHTTVWKIWRISTIRRILNFTKELFPRYVWIPFSLLHSLCRAAS